MFSDNSRRATTIDTVAGKKYKKLQIDYWHLPLLLSAPPLPTAMDALAWLISYKLFITI